jgi:hypothetical protein
MTLHLFHQKILGMSSFSSNIEQLRLRIPERTTYHEPIDSHYLHRRVSSKHRPPLALCAITKPR